VTDESMGVTGSPRCWRCGADNPKQRPAGNGYWETVCDSCCEAGEAEAKPGNDALRYDDDKAAFDLIPPEAMEALAWHYTRGARKYERRNWEKGMNWCRCFGSMMRHAWAWMRGEDFDPETSSHHMIAVAWNAIALFSYSYRGIGKDDRPQVKPTCAPAPIRQLFELNPECGE
jgi:hypothetical protein